MSSLPFEPTGPDERLLMQGVMMCSRPSESLWRGRTTTLTNRRIAATDEQGFVFHAFIEDIAAASLETPWKGPRVQLVLKGGNTVIFTTPGTTNGAIKKVLQPWVNKLNELLVLSQRG